jgi:hypothetical protein
MKKTWLFVSVACLALLISSFAVAASTDKGSVPREPTVQFDGETNFTNIAVTGKNVDGVPGYIKFYSLASNNTTVVPWYVWVDSTGDLRITSNATMITYTSFPDVAAWSTSMGSVVGSQT